MIIDILSTNKIKSKNIKMFEANESMKTNKMYRSYTETCENDNVNIMNGRCPDYALKWGINENKKYWGKNHNFLKGQNKNKNNYTKNDHHDVLREILNDRFEKGYSGPILYCDLDGVLADFVKGVENVLGKHPDLLKPNTMWPTLKKTPGFYADLEWTPEGKELWQHIKCYHPIILTGVPFGEWAEEDKRKWCAKNLGENVKVITCYTTNKPFYCVNGSVLIDDRDNIKEQWENSQGIFIHYEPGNLEEIIKNVDEHMSEATV